MLPTPAEQQEQLFQLLNGMRSAEHESFLGHWLYPLIEVHHTYIILGYLLHVYTCQAYRDVACPPLVCGIGGGSGGARRKDHRHAARDGPGRDSPPSLLPRHGALDLAQAQHFVHTRPLARLRVVCCSYWIKSRKRKGCLALHTPTTTNPAHPTPIPAPSLLTISRHAPTCIPSFTHPTSRQDTAAL